MAEHAIAENVRRERERLGWSQDKLAVESKTSQTTIDNIERGLTRRSKYLPQIAIALGVSIHVLDEDLPAAATTSVFPMVGSRTSRGDLPVYASAQGGRGEIIVNFEPIDYVGRPEVLVNVRDGYGMYIVGDSMSPRYEPGDMALVNPHRPAKGGDDVILFRSVPVGPTEALVKRLVRSTAERWDLKQFNPGKDFKLAKTEWPVCHVIVGRY